MEIPTGKCDLGGMHSTCVARSGPTKSAAASAAAGINTSPIVFPFAEGVGVRVGSDLRRRRRHPIPSKHEPEHILQFHGRYIILELVVSKESATTYAFRNAHWSFFQVKSVSLPVYTFFQ